MRSHYNDHPHYRGRPGKTGWIIFGVISGVGLLTFVLFSVFMMRAESCAQKHYASLPEVRGVFLATDTFRAPLSGQYVCAAEIEFYGDAEHGSSGGRTFLLRKPQTRFVSGGKAYVIAGDNVLVAQKPRDPRHLHSIFLRTRMQSQPDEVPPSLQGVDSQLDVYLDKVRRNLNTSIFRGLNVNETVFFPGDTITLKAAIRHDTIFLVR